RRLQPRAGVVPEAIHPHGGEGAVPDRPDVGGRAVGESGFAVWLRRVIEMWKRSAVVAVPVLVPLLFTAARGAEPPADKGRAKPREVVFRPVTFGKPIEYRLPEKAAARLAELVGKAGREGTVSPDAPRLAPDGTFVLDGKAYHFYAEGGLLRHNPS